MPISPPSVPDDSIPFPTKTSVTPINNTSTNQPTTQQLKRNVSHHRRSIRDLSSEYDSGLALQHYLQTTFSKRILSVFFTIHIKNQENPVYVSEIIHQTSNPQFQEFDLSSSAYGESSLIVSIWGKSQIDNNYTIFSSKYVELSELEYLGNSISAHSGNYPLNTIFIILRDGWYSVSHSHLKEVQNDIELDGSMQQSLSFDAIMKINNLQACLIDAKSTDLDATIQINEALESHNENLFLLRKRRNELQNRLKKIKENKAAQLLKISHTEKKIQQCKRDMKNCSEIMVTGESRQRAIRRNSLEIEDIISTDQIVIKDEVQRIEIERSRIAQGLSFIFPLLPISGEFLKFTICGLPLLTAYSGPSNGNQNRDRIIQWVKDEFNLDEEDVTGAAYGFACQLVMLLSFYLGVPLRYPMQPYGSQSFIIDPISAIQGSRTFPLWTKGSLYFRFQYAAFLFNKNVEQLLNSQGIQIADVKQVLGNLKNLLLILSTKYIKEETQHILND